jgi:hypothetical protein
MTFACGPGSLRTDILGYFQPSLSKLDICDGRKKTGQYMKGTLGKAGVVGFCFVSGHDF